MVIKVEVNILKFEEVLKEIKVLEKIDDYNSIFDFVENVLDEQRGFFYKLNYSRIGIFDKVMDVCINLEFWDRVLVFGF